MSGSYIERLREIGSEIASDATLSASQRELALQGVEDALNALRGADRDQGSVQSHPRRVLGAEAVADSAGVVFGVRPRRKRGAPRPERKRDG
ncbi:hypothetical protein QP923_02290 [Corynebacterium sp. MSK151]|uniref:hypothetical protein n=1 Tax=unclassified Corynebacterium TaxID=2624378 RepID=UPI0006602F2C|nr:MULTISPECIES: hypothetical protein [unclassified Corynebacterium]MBC6821420.1 hypothetical protein [Corynebacterium sp. LK33]MBC6832658.1 hypothetical protein [Corynebacterium sp. LK29]MDK8758424.1 hypothetical protein [Corynebacterium sp. MSK151]MDK8847597.1 hypothetical protein [Corynebacterium sp. MSK047]OFJ59531.1 hypothetical protein HMPREF2857_07170 [Corynebacterium sp. HMSC076C10]